MNGGNKKEVTQKIYDYTTSIRTNLNLRGGDINLTKSWWDISNSKTETPMDKKMD